MLCSGLDCGMCESCRVYAIPQGGTQYIRPRTMIPTLARTRSHRLGQVASGICLNFAAMFFTLCQELHELFQEDDLELSFSDHDAEDKGFEQLMGPERLTFFCLAIVLTSFL